MGGLGKQAMGGTLSTIERKNSLAGDSTNGVKRFKMKNTKTKLAPINNWTDQNSALDGLAGNGKGEGGVTMFS